MINSSHVDAQLKRIQTICEQLASQTAQHYAYPKLTIYASISPSMDRESSVITVIVGTKDGGMELPSTSEEISNESLELITNIQIQGFINSSVRKFLMLE